MTPKLIPVACDLISKMSRGIGAQSHRSRLLACTDTCTGPVPDSDFPYLPYGWSGDRSWESFDLGVQCGSLEVAIAVAV